MATYSTTDNLQVWVSTRAQSAEAVECRRILRGEMIPTADQISRSHDECMLRQSIVHVIRHNAAVANLPEVAGMCQSSRNAVFTRACNARLIMSNIIPDVDEPQHVPYCIWFPDLATPETYSKLAKHYPGLRYLVAPACAVGGYISLYRELDLLPDVSIAEGSGCIT